MAAPFVALAFIVGSLAVPWGLAKDRLFSSIATSTPSSLASSTPSKKVYTYADLPPQLYRICSCESMQGGSKPPKHYEADGVTVMLGRVNKNDVGACQINIEKRNGHLEAASKKGLDVFKESDNFEYAISLYNKSGSQPWNWSKQCWAK
jgi:hypothetical protein